MYPAIIILFTMLTTASTFPTVKRLTKHFGANLRLLATTSGHSNRLLEKIQNKHLIPTSGYINGEFKVYNNQQIKHFDVISPSNGKVLTSLPRMSVNEVDESIKAAKLAFKDWKETTAFDRSRLLMKAANLMTQYTDDLAAILTLEAGKPFNEAKGEIGYAISFMEYYAEEAKRVNGHIIPPNVRNRRVLTIKQPIGPVALITPWNFPSAMITRKLAPALAAGCTAVIKPANETPLSALAICAILEEAGFPKGVVNCLTVAREEVEAVGRALCHSKDLRALSFTGSTNVGKWLMRESATTVKKLSLELGGNAAFIVFDDCDLQVAVNALMNAKFRNAGQVCIGTKRNT